MQPTLIVLPAGVERPMLVRRHDGRLEGFFLKDTGVPRSRIVRIVSNDDGQTWGEGPDALVLPDVGGLWGGLEVLGDADDEIHCFLMHDRGSGVFGAPLAGEGVAHEGPYHGKFLDIWHVMSRNGGEAWTEPQRIWEGFTGALNSVIQLRNGRIVLPFAWATGQTWANRVDTGLDAFSFSGGFYSTVVYSDDAGETWRQGTRDIKAWAPIPAYGADEPVAIQKLDGRVWMLLRTQTGRLYESFSDDGAEWSVARPTPLISSDSPVGLVRLSDKRLVLIWNSCQRFPYAFGGRHVLHAAISEDDGLTWRGHREVLRDPRRHDPPPTTGDFGTAYPFPVVTNDDNVLIVSGQGDDRILMVRLDPGWLYETRQASDFADGIEDWSIFGTAGVERQPHPDRTGAFALRLTKQEPGRTSGAVWNFPAGRRGRVQVRLQTAEGAGPFRLSLTDHFSTPFDPQDQYHNTFNVQVDPDGRIAGQPALEAGRWQTVELAWDTHQDRVCRVSVDGRQLTTVPQLHETLGVNYLRVVALAEPHDHAGLWIESAAADVEP